MSRSPFFEGAVPADVVADLRRSAPDAAGAYLNGLALLAGVAHLPGDYLPEQYRYGTLRALGAGFVAATGGVDKELWGGLLPSLPGDVAQWNALHRELRAIAWQGMSPRDAQAVQDGVYEETGRQFLPDTLSLLAGGLFGAVGTAARAPIRITPDILDDAGRFLGQKNAGANAPLFSSWLSKADNLAEIMPGGQVRYTTTITDPASSLNGRSVSVSYTEGFPDFSPFMTHPSGVRSVTIEMTGTNRIDFRRANEAAGHPEWGNRPPLGWTWHHKQNGTEMELIPSTINSTFSHIGGAALVRKVK
jgi:hypothetical protein